MFTSLFASRTVAVNNLLSHSEIMQLISAAPGNAQLNIKQLSQYSQSGEQTAAMTGSGSDFAEVRAYQQGDDLRHIDWRASARSQDTLVRTYHSELSRPLCLLIDRRSAMRFATRTRLKVTQALRMALWLGGGEARSGREISAVLFDSPCHWLPQQQGMLSLKLMARLANKPCPPVTPTSEPEQIHETGWNQLLSGLKQHNSQGSELILISDFSSLSDEHNKMLRMLGDHCKCRAIQITDPSEVSPSFSASLQLQWGAKQRYFSSGTSSAAMAQLTDELQARSEAMARRFQQADISYSQLSVEQDELSAFWFKTQK